MSLHNPSKPYVPALSEQARAAQEQFAEEEFERQNQIARMLGWCHECRKNLVQREYGDGIQWVCVNRECTEFADE